MGNKIIIPVWFLVAALFTSSALGILIVTALEVYLKPRATSEEVHLVYDYLHKNNFPLSDINRFDTIIKKYPPNEDEVALVLLHSEVAVSNNVKK